MANQQIRYQKLRPRRCGARRLLSMPESRLVLAFHPEPTRLRARAMMQSRVKSAVHLQTGTAGDNGFRSGAGR